MWGGGQIPYYALRGPTAWDNCPGSFHFIRAYIYDMCINQGINILECVWLDKPHSSARGDPGVKGESGL